MMKKIIKKDLMTRNDFEELIQNRVFEDNDIIKELKSMRDDVMYERRVKKIAD